MEWIAAAIVFVGFLVVYPRLTLYSTITVVVTAVVVVVSVVSYNSYSDYRQNAKIAEERAKVTASGEFGSPLCNEQYPVLVKINNGTDRDIVETKFKLILKRDGHSDTIDYANYLTDKIFPPHTSSYICKHFNVPKISAQKIAEQNMTIEQQRILTLARIRLRLEEKAKAGENAGEPQQAASATDNNVQDKKPWEVQYKKPQQPDPAPQKNEQANWWDKYPLAETQPKKANWWEQAPLTETQPKKTNWLDKAIPLDEQQKKPNWWKDDPVVDNSDNASEWVSIPLGKQPASNANDAVSNGYKIEVELVDIKFQN